MRGWGGGERAAGRGANRLKRGVCEEGKRTELRCFGAARSLWPGFLPGGAQEVRLHRAAPLRRFSPLSAGPRRAHRRRLRAVPSQGPGAELNFGPFAPTGGVAAPRGARSGREARPRRALPARSAGRFQVLSRQRSSLW